MIPPEQLALLKSVNATRKRGEVDFKEAELHHTYRHHHRLAVYGSLVPGGVNHHHLEPLPGTWERGVVRGERHPTGWGMTHGHPALIWSPEGGEIEVHVFTSPDLPGHWKRLDDFEGDEYRREVVPVSLSSGFTLTNLYVLAADISR